MMLLVHPETARKICVRAKVGSHLEIVCKRVIAVGINIDWVERR